MPSIWFIVNRWQYWCAQYSDMILASIVLVQLAGNFCEKKMMLQLFLELCCIYSWNSVCSKNSSIYFKQCVMVFLNCCRVPPIKISHDCLWLIIMTLVCCHEYWTLLGQKWKDGELGNLYDQEQSEWPLLAANEFHIRKVDELIKDNQQITQGELLSNLAFLRNMRITLLMFFNIRRVVKSFTCRQQR